MNSNLWMHTSFSLFNKSSSHRPSPCRLSLQNMAIQPHRTYVTGIFTAAICIAYLIPQRSPRTDIDPGPYQDELDLNQISWCWYSTPATALLTTRHSMQHLTLSHWAGRRWNIVKHLSNIVTLSRLEKECKHSETLLEINADIQTFKLCQTGLVEDVNIAFPQVLRCGSLEMNVVESWWHNKHWKPLPCVVLF